MERAQAYAQRGWGFEKDVYGWKREQRAGHHGGGSRRDPRSRTKLKMAKIHAWERNLKVIDYSAACWSFRIKKK